MRALILNDTRRGSFARHLGCETVMVNLLALCRRHGIEVVRTLTRIDAAETVEFRELLPQVEAVIVNGEGTLHHDSPNALALARAILLAKAAGKKTALVNAVWQGNQRVNECLGALDFIGARDSYSARELSLAGAAGVVTAADFSLWEGNEETKPEARAKEGALVVDSVDEVEARRLQGFALAQGRPFRVMQDWRIREGDEQHPLAAAPMLTAADLAGAGLVISGRFHAVCLALKAGTPFLAVPSNTHKLEALLHDAGVPAGDFLLPPGWVERPVAFWQAHAERAWQVHGAALRRFMVQAVNQIEQSVGAMASALGAKAGERPARVEATARPRRRVRVCYYNTWAGQLEEAAGYVARVPALNLAPMVANPRDAALMRKARLDCDWYGENARCFAAMAHEEIEFLPAWVCGTLGVLDVGRVPREPGEERWLITMGHQPQSLGPAAGKVFALLAKVGVRHLYYAFDEASRCMACFGEIAPSLDILIHDEFPLEEANRLKLKSGGRTIHRSWVANLVPGVVPFNEAPEEKILFLGSQLGLTPHRQRQIDFLKERFGTRFVSSVDHSVAVAERDALRRFKVGLCPEGRKFTTPAMAETHTDRPFWSGCLGLVPVSEDAKSGGRLQALHEQGLILRYPHGDLESLAAQCERALAMTNDVRRKIYDYFNRRETVGVVVAEAIAAFA